MNNIGLVISGNLTGFSRFYASPSANDILTEVKFDFDFRNFLTFLNSGEKAYAISFAPSVLAVSLVTRILDSFRRPGILVVTLLFPRRSKVEFAINPQIKNALYQLLNEINDKFYEKNFVNGMVNQNAAVLMQDYYTEILGNYILASDGMQRNINGNIEVASLNKRLGYVLTSEDNVPSYLASLCRLSYEGCHHVFFAQNPVQNLIAEEPVEVVRYRVQITNNRQTLQSVTLKDRIPNVRPEDGEIDIDKNYTYQQVLDGEAGRNIVAYLKGETIEITYRFGLEEKTIKFVFNEGGKEIPFTSIMPVLEFNGTFINIPSETYTFQGKEIYGPKRIKSRGSEYRIKHESENLDLRRIQDTCIIQVEHCFPLRIFFNQPEDKPKRIIFKSNHGEFPFTDVTNHLEAVLPGYQEEYSYTIESLYYEREAGFLSSGSQIRLPQLKPVSRNIPPTRQVDLKAGNAPMQPLGRQTTSNAHNKRGDTWTNETYAHSKGRQSEGAIQLGGGEIVQKQFPKPKENKYKRIMPLATGLLGICLLFLLLTYLFELWPFSDNKNDNIIIDETEYVQLVKIGLVDGSPTHDLLRLSDFKDFDGRYEDFNDLVEVFLFQDRVFGQDMELVNEEIPSDDIWYKFKVKVPNKKENFKYSFQIKIRNKDILIGSSDIFSDEFNEKDIPVYDKTVTLFVKTSELIAYKKALDNLDGKKELSQDEIKKISEIAQDLVVSGRCNELGNLILKLIKLAVDKAIKKADDDAAEKAERRAKEEQKDEENSSRKEWSSYLTGTFATIENIRGLKLTQTKDSEYKIINGTTVSQRAQAIIDALEAFKDGNIPSTSNHLSNEQNNIINEAQSLFNSADTDTKRKGIKKELKKQTSFGQVKGAIEDLKKQF